jgi:hypothetical protein
MKQLSSCVLMVSPSSFQFNAETAASNDFQNNIDSLSALEIQKKAKEEHQTMVNELKEKGIDVIVIEDTPSPAKPDAIFPNNWLMMHQDGRIIIFPMKNANRQLEKRSDIVELLQKKYSVKSVFDLSHYEAEDKALEGTGSIVFDHKAKIAYACISPRTDKDVLDDLCKQIGYKAHTFNAYSEKDTLIYHTNVVMCVGDGFVVIGLNTIKDKDERAAIIKQFEDSNLDIIDLNDEQLNYHFAGNMLQVKNKENIPFLVMSKRAFQSLNAAQIAQIEKHTQILPVTIDLIEQIGGGSARCMMAENFLEKL